MGGPGAIGARGAPAVPEVCPRPLAPVLMRGWLRQRRRPESAVPSSMRGSTPRRWARAGNHTAVGQVARSQYEKVRVCRPSVAVCAAHCPV